MVSFFHTFKNQNINIIYDKIPVELYVLTMKNTIIISAASTAMFTFNPTCSYYYTHKLYNYGRIFSQIEIGNPTSYIKNIDKLEEIIC